MIEPMTDAELARLEKHLSDYSPSVANLTIDEAQRIIDRRLRG